MLSNHLVVGAGDRPLKPRRRALSLSLSSSPGGQALLPPRLPRLPPPRRLLPPRGRLPLHQLAPPDATGAAEPITNSSVLTSLTHVISVALWAILASTARKQLGTKE